MPAKDLYHDTVKNALIKDGWNITDDPLILSIGKKDLFVDLGAEKLIAAEKSNQKIAVEVKSFIGMSRINDLEKALGQYILYREILREKREARILYLAIKQPAYEDIFEQPIGKILLKQNLVNLLVFDEIEEAILQWIQ
ncbi:MAG: fatty-acid synthase [Okeania sp. SIO3B5]|uniref:element excision factor XisH family protein n=1 Tax=Okeania sp. SIO3B5 TaxID=2607811 RepID=UPI0014008A42|nr:element excision factor XisH family protein [Okeania sp. SIO3B5]NEO52827.1 fatty-acid synthase [Okeania sp. SIO3B5]